MPYACLGLCTFSFGVVREGDLLVRWTFDEGNGSVANDVTGGGIDLLLSAYAGWGSEDVNNTAISEAQPQFDER